MDWSQFWSGTGGDIIGAAASTGIALFVLWRTRLHDQRQFRAQLNEDAARRITQAVIGLHGVISDARQDVGTPGIEQALQRINAGRWEMVDSIKLDRPIISNAPMRQWLDESQGRVQAQIDAIRNF